MPVQYLWRFSVCRERKSIVSMDSVSLKYQGFSYSQTLLEVLEALLQMVTNVAIVGTSAPRGEKNPLAFASPAISQSPLEHPHILN